MFEFIKQAEVVLPPQPENLNLYNNPALNPSVIFDKIDEISTMSDRELYNLVSTAFDSILRSSFHDQSGKFLRLFTQARFLTIFVEVLREHQKQLPAEDVIYANKLAYDYLTVEERDETITQLFFSLSKTVNYNQIQRLIGRGITEDLAAYIALSRNSSFDEKINVRRVNFVLVTADISIINSPQIIVWVYEALFSRISPLFESVMLDVLDEEADWITEDMVTIDANITIALLALLENMRSVDISQVLKQYTENYRMIYSTESVPSVRFSLRSISPGDYPRITSAVEELESNRIYVP